MISKAVECQERRWRFFRRRSDPARALASILASEKAIYVSSRTRGGESSLLFLGPSFPMSARFIV